MRPSRSSTAATTRVVASASRPRTASRRTLTPVLETRPRACTSTRRGCAWEARAASSTRRSAACGDTPRATPTASPTRSPGRDRAASSASTVDLPACVARSAASSSSSRASSSDSSSFVTSSRRNCSLSDASTRVTCPKAYSSADFPVAVTRSTYAARASKTSRSAVCGAPVDMARSYMCSKACDKPFVRNSVDVDRVSWLLRRATLKRRSCAKTSLAYRQTRRPPLPIRRTH